MSDLKLKLYILLSLLSAVVFAQDSTSITLRNTGDEYAFKNSDSIFANKKQLFSTLNDNVLHLYENGYLEASYKKVEERKSTHIYKLHLGPEYKIDEIDLSAIPTTILRAANVKEKHITNSVVHPTALIEIAKSINNYLENNGFPFSEVALDSLKIIEGKVSAKLIVNKNDLTTIDEIKVIGELELNPEYIYNYIGIEPGDLYNHSKIKKLKVKLKELSFIAEEKPSQISFSNKGATIYLFLKNKQASTFNGILGVLPKQKVAGNSTGNNIAITGDVRLSLINSIRRGETFNLKWRRLQSTSQDLELDINYPFVFGFPIGISGELNLFKQDSVFVNFDTDLGVSYLLRGSNYFKAFWENKGTIILADTLTSATQNVANNSSNSYGLELYLEDYDYRLNPTQGASIKLKSQVGTKRVGNSSEDEFFNVPFVGSDSLSGFITIPVQSTMYDVSLIGDLYIPFFQITTLKLKLNGAWLINDYLFNNDMMRIGGIRTLRGFDDASIRASRFLVGSAEYRMLLDRNSFLALFFDYAYVEKRSLTEEIVDFPYGFGAGISFETKAGIFSVNYAVGKQLDNALDFGAAKIHFGFLNQF